MPITPNTFTQTLLDTKKNVFIAKLISQNYSSAIFTGTSAPRDEIIDYAIRKSWCDATIYERMVGNSTIIANATLIKNLLANDLKNNIATINSNFASWHDTMCTNTQYGMRYGIWQKFINMTMKYLFCFDTISSPALGINWSDCHCPIDSIISKRILDLMAYYGIPDKNRTVESISKSGIGVPCHITWNNLTQNDYIYIQNLISDLCNSHSPKIPSKLIFDYLYW